MKKSLLIFFALFLVANISFVLGASSYSGKLGVSSSGGRIIISGPGQTPQHYCGNGIYEPYIYEQCDGNDLGEASCQSLGYDFGSLSCQENCVYDTSDCGNNPVTPPGTGGTGGGSSPGGGSSGGSSSSSSSSSCVESWICSEWGECKNGKQTRRCEDVNNCGTTSIKPSEEGKCVENLKLKKPLEQGLLSGLTGAVIGGGAGSIIIAIVFIVGIIVIYVLVSKKIKKKSYAKE